MTPRPWTPKPMWERTPSLWWKIVGPRPGDVVVVSVSEADARLICDSVNGCAKAYFGKQEERP